MNNKYNSSYMKSIDDICFIIQSRLSSTRVKKKMLRPFGNSSLFEIAIKKILQSSIIPKENFFVSVWENELKDIAKKHNVNIFHRSEKSSKAESSLQELFEWHDKLNFKYVIVINPCLPFLTINTIDNFVKDFLSNNYDGMFGVIKIKDYFWDKDGVLITDIGKNRCLNTKTVDHCFKAGHCLYASTMKGIKENNYMGNYTKNNPVLFPLNEEECIDIDYEWEFDMANAYYTQKYITI